MERKLITYDRKTKDFALYLNGELIGYAPTYLQAEATLNQLVYDLLTAAPAPQDAPPSVTDTDAPATTRDAAPADAA